MKLLRKTISQYLLYSVFILLVAIPLFYIFIENIVRDSVDEELMKDKNAITHKAGKLLAEADTSAIRFIDENSSIRSSPYSQPFDSLFTKEYYDQREEEYIPVRMLRSNILIDGKPFLLEIHTSLLETDDLVKSIVKVLALLLILLLAGLLLINHNLSRRIWKPFYATLEKLRLYEVEKQGGLELKNSSVEEFSDLNKTLEQLTTRAHQAYESQKEFTENAAHELQTPLAILQGKLELLMQTSPLNAEQAGLIDQLADASGRMLRLNKSLVLLSKIENNQFPETDEVNVGEVVRHFTQEFAEQVTQKQLSLSVSIDENIILHANRVLIEILIRNLLGNAIRHNVLGGTINITGTTQRLTIRNAGRTNSLDAKKVFARFQKESTDSSSIGLGLEIARKVCGLYGYVLNYDFKEGEHCFEVRFI